jgi:phage-related protein
MFDFIASVLNSVGFLVESVINLIRFAFNTFTEIIKFVPKLITAVAQLPTMLTVLPEAFVPYFAIVFSLCSIFLVIRIKQMIVA